MKFFALTSLLLTVAFSQKSLDCGQGKMPSKNGICIEPQYIQGCCLYSSPSQCNQCEKGYALKNNRCDALQFVDKLPKINGCLVRNQKDQNKCLNCANGFVRKAGTCEPGVKHCAKYKSDNSCSECKEDYSLVLNECRYNILLGCKKIKSDHTCQECWTPFTLKDSQCEISNCQSLNDYGCVTCQCGYFLNKNRTCDKTDDGCLRYERGKCINCLNHYRLKGGACEIQGCVKYLGNTCTQCKKQYDKVRGSCEFKDCVDWANDHCYSCKKGYKLQDGVCEKQDPILCID